MPSAPKVPLEDRWAGVAGMPELLDALKTYEDELLAHEVAEESADDAVRDGRLAVIAHLRVGLSTFDPPLMSPTLLASLQSAIQNARTELVNYGWASQGGEHTLTDITRTIAVPASAEGIASVVSSVKALYDLEQQLKTSVDAATTALGELTAARTTFEESAGAAIETGEAKVGEAVTSLTEKGGQEIARKLKEAEDDRSAAAQAFKEAHDAAEQVLQEMREKLSIATDTALSHDYSKAAETESGKADTMRTRSVVFGVITGVIAMAAVALQAVIVSNSNDAGEALALVPGKLAAVAAFGTIAAWLGRESNRHREAARSLRLTELQLRNLGSFLAELEPTDRNDARVRLLGRFFSDQPQPIEPDGPSHLHALQQMGGGQDVPT